MKFNYFVPRHFNKFVDTCRNIVQIQEPGMLLFFPKTDRERRIEQLIQDHTFDCPVHSLQLNTLIVNEVEDVPHFIEQKFAKKKGEKVCIFVIRSEVAVEEQSTAFIDALIDFQSKDKSYCFVFVSETDFTHPDISKHFSSQTRIFNHINYYSLYDEEDSLAFLDHLAHEWKQKPDSKKNKAIYGKCGGHFWLLKEALRTALLDTKKHVDEICDSETMTFRIEQIYFSMLEDERAVLKKLIMKEEIGENAGERHSLRYLTKIKLVQHKEITIPLLEQYIKTHTPKVNIGLSKNHIIVNNVIVDSNFSRKEMRVLRILMEQVNQIVPRDNVAKSIWPIDTDSYYSEWAIDRIMSRLRDKLEKLGIDKNIIKTLRGKGYSINL